MGIDVRGQVVAWAAAGIPLLIAFLQTLLALFGYTSSGAGLTPVAEPVLSVPVFYEAAIVFKDSSTVVMALFGLIVAAWAAQGAAMQLLEHREAAYSTATLSAVLFFALFFGVYAPLASADVPAAQLGAFYLVPIFAAALQLYAVRTYPWNEVVLEETSGDLADLETDLADTRSTFDSGFDARFGRLDELEPVAPGGVEDVRDGRAAFHERLDELASDIEDVRQLDDGEEAANARAALETELAAIDPEAELDGLDERLERALVSGLRTEYGEFVVRSPFDERFRAVNLPTEYRELSVPHAGEDVHVDHVDEVLVDLARDTDDYAAVAEAIEAVDDHRSATRSYIESETAPIVDTIRTTQDRLETVESQVERIDTPFSDRVEQVLVEGHHPELVAVRDVESAVSDARAELHDCAFEEAAQIADGAAEDAGTLVSTVELLTTLESSIDAGHRTVSIPPAVQGAYIAALVPAIRSGYPELAVSFDEASGQLEFDHGDATPEPESDDDSDGVDDTRTDASGTTDTVTSTTGRNDTGRIASPEAVVDGVLYAFRDFASSAEEGERIVQYRTSDLPDSVATADVLGNVERFASRQSDLFDAVDLQGTDPPGYIEFTAADGVSIDRAMEQAHSRFREKYT